MVDNSLNAFQLTASLTLVLLALAVAWWMRLGLTRSLLVASARAAVQLLAVGAVLGLILESASAEFLAWLWVAGMVAVTAVVARRRAPDVPRAGLVSAVAVVTTVGLCLAIVFGFGIIDYRPVNLIVIAGITIGNTLPGLVLGSKQVVEAALQRRGQIEALMALGMSITQIVRFTGGPIVGMAMVPQIERTNVVGLIALPGAMTGLLLGGVAPIDAVMVQLVVMYLVLGATSLAVIISTTMGLRNLFTPSFTLVPIRPDRAVS